MPPPHTGAAPLQIVAKQIPGADLRVLRRLSSAQLELWRRIGQGTTLQELARLYRGQKIMTELRSLEAMGSISLEEIAPTPRSQFAGCDLIDPSPQEESLLNEDTDLEPWETHRILAVARAVEMGQYLELLKIERGASRRELKRAYYSLSKEFHPDQYFGRNIGGFKALLERVFEAISQFVKTLGDPRTATQGSARAGGPTRRSTARYPLAVPAQLASEAFGATQAVSQDISVEGAFLVTELLVEVGTNVDLSLETNNGPLLAKGTVVSQRNTKDAAQHSRNPGLGIRFTAVDKQQHKLLMQLVSHAKDSAPWAVMGDTAQNKPAPTRRIARGTGAIHRSAPIVGIDLGTTNTSVSGVLGNSVHVLDWPNGRKSIPSIVAFPERGKCVVGDAAKRRLLKDPRYVIASGKRLIGRQADDPNIAGFLADASFPFRDGPDGSVVATLWGEDYAMAQICSYLFAACKHAAEQALQDRISQAVLTVPVSFTPERVAMMRRAASMAHVDVVDVIEEPSAAALANFNDRDFGGIIGVYDFGGGTFDFSLVEAGRGDLRVLATAGDSWLGGDDFDLAIANAAADLFWRTHGVDLRRRAVEWQYLVYSCEKAKRQLSRSQATRIVIPEVVRTVKGAFDLRIGLSRDKVEPLWASAIQRSVDTCLQAMSIAGVAPRRLSAIYLSGGTSAIPLIQRALAARFQVPVRIGVPVEHAVCAGAGVHAAQLERRTSTVLPHR